MFCLQESHKPLGAAPTNTLTGNATPSLGGSLTYNLISPGAASPGNGGNYITLTVVTPGIYLANFCINQSVTSGSITNFTITITGTNSAVNGSFGYSTITPTSFSCQGCQTIICTASAYNLQANYLGATLSNFTGFFYLTRIG